MSNSDLSRRMLLSLGLHLLMIPGSEAKYLVL